MSEEIAAEIEAVRALPRLSISIEEAAQLPEYSCTLPTAKTPGFRWRRRIGTRTMFTQGPRHPWPHWIVCEFGDVRFDAGLGRDVIAILCYRVAIRVPAVMQ